MDCEQRSGIAGAEQAAGEAKGIMKWDGMKR
jgi:hypothetical protein